MYSQKISILSVLLLIFTASFPCIYASIAAKHDTPQLDEELTAHLGFDSTNIAVHTTKHSCPHWCWLRTAENSKDLIDEKCDGFIKECKRNGKIGFTCDCDAKRKSDSHSDNDKDKHDDDKDDDKDHKNDKDNDDHDDDHDDNDYHDDDHHDDDHPDHHKDDHHRDYPYDDALKCDHVYIRPGYLKPGYIHKPFHSIWVLMDGPYGYFDFYWGTYHKADKITILQGGYKIFSSDGPINGYGKAKVELNGKSRKIRVVVNRVKDGSLFDFYPSCIHSHHDKENYHGNEYSHEH